MTFYDLNNFIHPVKEKIRKAKIVFDIGAYDFADSNHFTSLNDSCIVHAFEASPLNYAAFSNSFKHNTRLYTHNVAISNCEGTELFYDSGDGKNTKSFSGSLLKPSDKLKENKVFNFSESGVLVTCTTLDMFCDRNGILSIDFMHIDAQGAEYKVIEGMTRILPEFIFAETCEQESYQNTKSKECFDSIMSVKGYKVLQELQYDTLYGLK